MTLQEFKALLCELPESIGVVHFRGLSNVFPRLIWQEARTTQTYASNNACEEHITVVAEYLTRSENDQGIEQVKALFRGAQLPFDCYASYDEVNDIISYLFNAELTEVIPWLTS